MKRIEDVVKKKEKAMGNINRENDLTRGDVEPDAMTVTHFGYNGRSTCKVIQVNDGLTTKILKTTCPRCREKIAAKLFEDMEQLSQSAKLRIAEIPSHDFFTHPIFKRCPAVVALADKADPTIEHLRACVMELARVLQSRFSNEDTEEENDGGNYGR